jgi:broad specificity phosphatase PhoE
MEKRLTTRVIIVRHGQSSYNSQRRIQGRCDESVLTEKGRADALKVGETLRSLKFDAIYASPLQRAKTTAELILSCLDYPTQLQTSPNLMEIDLPLWEKMIKQDVKDKFPDQYKCWKQRPHEFCMSISGENGSKDHFPVLALYKQAGQFWQELLSSHQGETILIVAHNGINRALISTALGIPAARYHSIQQSNCGVSVLNFAGNWGEPVQLESMNQIGHMGLALPEPREGHPVPRLLLVRHGETEWNRQTRFQGQIDIPLNDNGRQQAQKAAEFLKEVPIHLAVTSPMVRPKETAEIILQYHPDVQLELNVELSEISHGLWEGKLEAEIEQAYPGELERWRNTPAEVQMPEGENLQQVWDRATEAWNDIVTATVNESQTCMVVAHDATNKVILCHVMGLGLEDFWKIKQGNGAVTVIDYPQGVEGMPVLQSLNITSHLSGSILDKTAAGAL